MALTRRSFITLLAGAAGLGPAVAASRARAAAAAGVSSSAVLSGRTGRPWAGGARFAEQSHTLSVIGREGWTDRRQGRFHRHRVTRATIHHTEVSITDNRRAPERLRNHLDWHISHGWPDIAYHFIVDRNGNVYEGRPVDAAGDTFTGYDTTGHLLACFEGDFNRQSPSNVQLAAMAKLLAWAMRSHSIGFEAVGAHRDWANTTCPGADVYWRLDGLARSAGDHGPVELSYIRDGEARDRVAAISQGSA